MYLLLFANAILLSAIAAYYSIVGLIAIFAAAAIPVAIMGSSLEVAKLVVASWLYRYWAKIPVLMRIYFTSALILLMVITSMGIFGFLSKAHMDQGITSGDILAKISVYDEKIKTSKENIDANRKALKQMDVAVDQVMGRSSDEKGADKAVAIRRGQQKERARLQSEIATEQKAIAALNEEAAPIRTEVRKVEAEVGPIKYIAALLYGDNPDSNTLEKAVRILIIVLIFVFDPLAVLMLIAANLTQIKSKEHSEDKVDSPVSSEPVVDNSEVTAPVAQLPIEEINLEWQDESETSSTVVETTIAEEAEEILAQGVTNSTPEDNVPLATTVTDFEGVREPGGEWQQTGPEFETKKEVKVEEELPKEEVKKPARRKQKVEEPVKQDTYKEENISMDFNSEVDKMIESGDDNGLEGIYKKIVKELGKKNRAKTTHWGPIKSSPTDNKS